MDGREWPLLRLGSMGARLPFQLVFYCAGSFLGFRALVTDDENCIQFMHLYDSERIVFSTRPHLLALTLSTNPMRYQGLPPKQGLYDPQLEKDSCGIGFIAHIKGKRSHQMVEDGLTILNNLAHRGACGCDPRTGDGARPVDSAAAHAFFKQEGPKLNINIPSEGEYGAGIVFLAPRKRRAGFFA